MLGVSAYWHVWTFLCLCMESVGISSFIDTYSRFGYVYSKSNALDKFFEFKVELDNPLGKHIRHFDWIQMKYLVSLILP